MSTLRFITSKVLRWREELIDKKAVVKKMLKEELKDMVQMKVYDVGIDPTSNVPIVFLKDLDETFAMPIWIGVAEAAAIATQLHSVSMPRPMTHDLLKNILKELNVQLERIVIYDLADNTFFANIHLKAPDREIVVDARPSDSLALALRMSASVWVSRKVLDRAHLIDLTNKTEAEKWSEILDKMDPEDFGKYKM